MPYDHQRKAGNRGDVWKHAVLASIADRVAPVATFRYVETHSGAPTHTLSSQGEWIHGIHASLACPGAVTPYFALAKKYVTAGLYPAGWVIFAARACARVGHLVIQLHDVDDGVARRYGQRAFDGCPINADVSFTLSDGIESLASTTKPDLVFLDPPFSPDAEADWRALAVACSRLAEDRTPFVAWYPFYWHTKPQQLVDRTGQVSWEAHWAECGAKPSQNLKG